MAKELRESLAAMLAALLLVFAWRHHDGRGGGDYVRRNRRLIVSSWFTVGNYDCE